MKNSTKSKPKHAEYEISILFYLSLYPKTGLAPPKNNPKKASKIKFVKEGSKIFLN